MEATGDSIGNKIADKITRVSKKLPQNSSKELHSKHRWEWNKDIKRKIHISRKRANNWLIKISIII